MKTIHASAMLLATAFFVGAIPQTRAEIGIISLDEDGNLLESWGTLVNPGRDLGPTDIHGIRGRDVEGARSLADAWRIQHARQEEHAPDADSILRAAHWDRALNESSVRSTTSTRRFTGTLTSCSAERC